MSSVYLSLIIILVITKKTIMKIQMNMRTLWIWMMMSKIMILDCLEMNNNYQKKIYKQLNEYNVHNSTSLRWQ